MENMNEDINKAQSKAARKNLAAFLTNEAMSFLNNR